MSVAVNFDRVTNIRVGETRMKPSVRSPRARLLPTAITILAPCAVAQGLDVPAKTLPVPDTVSPQIQRLIAAPRTPGWDLRPKTGEESILMAEADAAETLKSLPGLMDRMKVKVKKTSIDGVRAFIVTPERVAPVNLHRVLIHMHGGCYVLSPGEAGLPEAVLMAGLGKLCTGGHN